MLIDCISDDRDQGSQEGEKRKIMERAPHAEPSSGWWRMVRGARSCYTEYRRSLRSHTTVRFIFEESVTSLRFGGLGRVGLILLLITSHPEHSLKKGTTLITISRVFLGLTVRKTHKLLCRMF